MFARHFAANFVNILILACLVIGAIVYWGRNEMTVEGPLTADTVFEVKRGESFNSVSNRLGDSGIISSPSVFRMSARYSGQDRKLKFGEYQVRATASMTEVLELVTSGKGIQYQVTIPEGFSSFQIVERLKANEDLTGEIKELPIEGSLAPNTYAYNRGDSRETILKKMRDEQVKILDAAWSNRQADLPYKNKEEALVMASIVEKETGVASERDVVAAVFVNRLRKGMRLQTDPTVIYGLTNGERVLGRGLRRSELVKKTPYNTYVIPALPPGPIANPGKAAIEAALNPAESPYLFFVADGTGGHVFAETLKQHNVNVAKWRAIERQRKAEEKKNQEN